eukprot:13701410-Alexandrium_andersonii.AAC.1
MEAQHSVQEKSETPCHHCFRAERGLLRRPKHLERKLAEPSQGRCRVVAVVLLVEGRKLCPDALDANQIRLLVGRHVRAPDLRLEELPEHEAAPHAKASKIKGMEKVNSDRAEGCDAQGLRP